MTNSSKNKTQRAWGKQYLLGVRIGCGMILLVALYFMWQGSYVAAVVTAMASPFAEIALYRCPYCKTRLKAKQKLPPHCLCPECHREL